MLSNRLPSLDPAKNSGAWSSHGQVSRSSGEWISVHRLLAVRYFSSRSNVPAPNFSQLGDSEPFAIQWQSIPVKQRRFLALPFVSGFRRASISRRLTDFSRRQFNDLGSLGLREQSSRTKELLQFVPCPFVASTFLSCFQIRGFWFLISDR